MAEQETNKEIKMVDIVDFSMQDKPVKVTDAFNSLISNKVVDSITSKKQDVATSMFTSKVEEPPAETTETE